MLGSYDIRKQLLVARLPSLPHILIKLMEYCQTDEIGMDKLAELIAKDTAIASKILTTATSSAYRLNGQKVQLEQALITLGTDMIRTLVISESLFQTFNGVSASGGVDLRSFWKHSLTTAVMARDIAKETGYANIDEAYLGGLLHDIGRLAFLAVAPGQHTLTFLLPDDDNLCTAEQKALHLTHQEAGAWLIERWKMAPCLADSVLYHHEPSARVKSAHPLVRIVLVAHQLCCHGVNDEVTLQASALCGLSAGTLEAISRGASAKVLHAASFLGLDLTGIDNAPTPADETPPQQIQQKMGEELHNLVLASEAGRTFALHTNRTELLEAILQSACILFNLDDAIMLTFDHERQVLTPADERRQRLSQLSIPLTDGGPMAEAVRRQCPVFIHRDQPLIGITEAQLLRTLDAESLTLLPLVSRGRCLGVLAAGAMPLAITNMKQSARFMLAFASQAAAALQTLESKEQVAARKTAIATEEFRLSSLKMAHEASNPLAIIRNYLGLLNDKLMKQEPVSDEISILNQEIDRVGNILRRFAETQPSKRPEPLDVNAVIHDVARLFRDSGFAPHPTQIVTRTEGQPTHAECDRDVLTQILMNLIRNAIEAIPHDGMVQIANNGHTRRNDKPYLHIVVTDTGPGIPADILKNLFHPVASTKGEQHRGLGLSIVHDLVSKSNGLIACNSSHTGTLFEICLPVSAQQGSGMP